MIKEITWDKSKNEKLKKERGVCVEQVIEKINKGDLLDKQPHRNPEYSHQKVIYLIINNYTYFVPCIETETHIHLVSIIPSRKYNKLYRLP